MSCAFLKTTLAEYGACITPEGFIVGRGGNATSVRAVAKRGRIRFESRTGHLIASGPLTPEFVREFVWRYWYWTPCGD